MSSSHKGHRPRYPSLSTTTTTYDSSSTSVHSARSSSSQASSCSIPIPASATRDRYNPAPLPSPTVDDQPYFDNVSQSLGRQAAQQHALAQSQRQLPQQFSPQDLATLQQYQQMQQQQQQQYQQQQQQLQHQQYVNHQQAYQQSSYQQYQQYQQHEQMYNGAVPQASNPYAVHGASDADAYINRFALVAEAAKRAQMAVLERDFGGVDLG